MITFALLWLIGLTAWEVFEHYDGKRAGRELAEDLERKTKRATPEERERYADVARLERFRRG